MYLFGSAFIHSCDNRSLSMPVKQKISEFSRFFEDLSHFIFPINCLSCGRAMDAIELTICEHCKSDMPLTKYWQREDQPVARIFWGKLPISRASSFLFYQKGSKVQNLIHALKYRGKTEVGEMLGSWYGEELRTVPEYLQADVIIPVPLHPSRLRKRGYNQCDFIARGISNAMDIELELSAVQRLRFNESQTKKGTYDRWINVRELFRVERPHLLAGKHILLVDDVVTTGSTLEACAAAILKVPDTRVSIATLASPAPF